MLSVNLSKTNGIVILEPDGKLSEADFQSATEIIDPYIEKTGDLNGLIIHTRSFPGWDSISAMMKHLKFVKDHHKNIRFVALVTDSTLAGFGEHISSHFISAEIKGFPFNELSKAQQWIIDRSILQSTGVEKTDD